MLQNRPPSSSSTRRPTKLLRRHRCLTSRAHLEILEQWALNSVPETPIGSSPPLNDQLRRCPAKSQRRYPLLDKNDAAPIQSSIQSSLSPFTDNAFPSLRAAGHGFALLQTPNCLWA
ncbi:UNVERIFIED_CONTAM: hypothetical protein Sradi_0668500 [Sesamum radiatum]|uniref:Uncharacterized protein n=1 Tax=Sesamum radiatum TaxID=300843 RepID=A0AAW2VQU8_SESRA